MNVKVKLNVLSLQNQIKIKNIYFNKYYNAKCLSDK